MTMMILAVLLGAATAALFGAAVPGAVFAVLALSIVYSIGLELVAAAVRVRMARKAAEEMKAKLAEAVNKAGGFGTYL